MRNALKTAVLLAALGGLFMALGGAVAGQGGLIFGLVMGLLFVGGSFWFSDTIAIKVARARPLAPGELPELRAIVEDLARRAGIPTPRLYVAPDPQPNAFATGRSPRHAAVAVTAGILEALTWDELRGVLAHELAHVRNRDVLLSSVAAAVALAITFVARMAMWGAMLGGNDRDRNPLATLAMVILAPLAAMILQMALSRSREFEADRTGARLIGDGEPLARALEKLEAYASQVPSASATPETAQAYIVNPLKANRVDFKELFSTHPSTAERVRRLRSGEWRSNF
ncbi:MAG: protease [Acidimicrobiales bacterium]|nr:MAG: protease [Acidimicrobiales bacterium]